MAASVLLTFDELAKLFGQMGADWSQVPREAIRKAGDVAYAEIMDGFARSRAPDGTPWAPLKRRRPGGGGKGPLLATGAMRDSIQLRYLATGFEAFTNRVRAAVHQYGATITPRRAKMLAIPLTAEAQAAGSPRKFPGLLVPVTRGGKGVLVERTGKRGRPKAQYALVRSVKIPARPFLGFSAKAVDGMSAILADASVETALRRLS